MSEAREVVAVDVILPHQVPAMLAGARAGDPEAMLTLYAIKSIFAKFRDEPNRQMCLLCDHLYADVYEVAAWALATPLAQMAEGRGEMVVSGLCGACLDKGNVIDRLMAEYERQGLFSDITVLGRPSEPGHA